MGLPKPSVVATLQGRKAALDAAEDAATGEKKEAPEPKKEELKSTGLPKPSLFKKLKSVVTGGNPYVE